MEQQTTANPLHAMWSSVAPAWGDNADFTDERGAVATERMLTLAALSPGDRVLELACGAGGLGLAAAERIGSDGEVVLSDVAAEMTAIAAERASARGPANVTTAVLDIEVIDEPDAAYDVVLCREGLMFARDPGQAASEIRRVLRPGGRVVLAVWGERERNPWLGIVLDAVSAQVGAPVPPPGVPGPFALSDGERLAALLSEAGLADVAVEEHDLPMSARSFDEWWSRTTALAGPLANLLASLPDDAQAAIRAQAREASEAYAGAGGLDFPGMTLIASARA